MRAITSDEDVDSFRDREKIDVTSAKNAAGGEQHKGMTKDIAGESISDEVWDEFNALLDDEPDATTAGGSDMNIEQETTTEATQTADQSGFVASTEAAAPSSKTVKPKKKKKKRKKQITDSYDNEGLVNVEQASYEARLARLVLMKSKLHNSKSESGVHDDALKSIDFYDPGLAFHQDDNDDEEDEQNSVENSDSKKTHDDYKKAIKKSSSHSTSNASTPSGSSLAKILRKRRKEAKQAMSDKIIDANDPKQDESEGLVDGFWF